MDERSGGLPEDMVAELGPAREAQAQGHRLAGVGDPSCRPPSFLGQGSGWVLTPGADGALMLSVTVCGRGHGGLGGRGEEAGTQPEQQPHRPKGHLAACLSALWPSHPKEPCLASFPHGGSHSAAGIPGPRNSRSWNCSHIQHTSQPPSGPSLLPSGESHLLTRQRSPHYSPPPVASPPHLQKLHTPAERVTVVPAQAPHSLLAPHVCSLCLGCCAPGLIPPTPPHRGPIPGASSGHLRGFWALLWAPPAPSTAAGCPAPTGQELLLAPWQWPRPGCARLAAHLLGALGQSPCPL